MQGHGAELEHERGAAAAERAQVRPCLLQTVFSATFSPGV